MNRYIKILLLLLTAVSCLHPTGRRNITEPFPDRCPVACNNIFNLKITPEVAEPLNEACRMACAGNFDDALNVLNNAAAENDTFDREPAVAWLKADIFFKLQRYEDALTSLNLAAMNGAVDNKRFRRDARRIRNTVESAWTDGIGAAEDAGNASEAFRLIHLRNAYFDVDADWIRKEMDAALKAHQPDAVMAAAKRLNAGDTDTVFEMVGDAWRLKGNPAQAVKAYIEALSHRPDPDVAGKLLDTRTDYASTCIDTRLPDIRDAPWVNRAELAMLIRCWFPELEARDPVPVIRDIFETDAADDIRCLTSLGILPVDRNHCFYPNDHIRRLDLAIACAALLDHFHPDLTVPDPVETLPKDVSPAHYAAREIRICTYFKLINLTDDGRFEASRTPVGSAVLETLSRLVRYVHRYHYERSPESASDTR